MTREQEIANAVQAVCLADISGTGAIGATTVYVSGEPYRIEVERSTSGPFASDRAWDSIIIDGIRCGNRFGGVRMLLIMLGVREPDYQFADREAVARRDGIAAAV